MSGTIRFDSGKYDQLITQLGAALKELGDGAAGPLALTADVQLQPSGQTWQPAVDLVGAGTALFGLISENNDSLKTGLGDLSTALAQGRSIFNDVEDLAAATAGQFDQVVGHPLGAVHARNEGAGAL
ncbi:hypothetical protein FF36_05291 [Frankia torreyi]|uniref:Excreted virulence factor EspC, type VII ESX diderm n=1 Tax=Frankia torreyi TaxID=1856 RepID=A0A0D8BAJ5_9ACTN|nr:MULTISPECIES: hypothetical protein [Frankia]KJE20392.1 hypothetical protein FF36_05291 [Frankia torreyi]KQC35621.1 hypothetical protein UK82_25435 [Frankia sp. ACN1ag]KQM02798.1 hypothetical protein FF86_10556 [Frankia sp. CpI1-P]